MQAASSYAVRSAGRAGRALYRPFTLYMVAAAVGSGQSSLHRAHTRPRTARRAGLASRGAPPRPRRLARAPVCM